MAALTIICATSFRARHFVFERKVAAHPDCIPADNHLFLGDARESIPRPPNSSARAALIHTDLGIGDHANMAMGKWSVRRSTRWPGPVATSSPTSRSGGALALPARPTGRSGRPLLFIPGRWGPGAHRPLDGARLVDQDRRD